MPFPTVEAEEFHDVPAQEALRLVDERLGPANGWSSGLVSYRMTSDFQADWKEELGRWLLCANKNGYLDRALRRLLGVRGKPSTGEIDPNDPAHAILHQDTAAMMVAYYLEHTGWKYAAWEPKRPRDCDVDLCMIAPDGTEVDIQVKGSDRPGRIDGAGQIQDGENDQHVLTALDKAAKQLVSAGDRPKLIFMCAWRRLPLAAHPLCVLRHLHGSTIQYHNVSGVKLPHRSLGKFHDPSWGHVNGVVLLDYVRPVGQRWYFCTAIPNPCSPVICPNSWFPRSFVLRLTGSRFGWHPRPPGDDHTFPDGTEIIAEDPPWP